MIKLPIGSVIRKGKSHLTIDEFLIALRTSSKVGLNLGCGVKKIEHVINCDLYAEQADLKISALELSGFEDATIDYIETHHMIEHLSREEACTALREWHRKLCEGGCLVITCPDFKRVVFKWFKYWLISPVFNNRARRDYIMKMLYGNQENEGQFHKYGYDEQSLCSILRNHGYDVVFSYSGYPKQTTPSMIIIARKRTPDSAGSV